MGTRKGFTLIELIIAIVVAGVISIGVAIFLSEYLNSTVFLHYETFAMNLARMEIEKTNNIAIADLGNALWNDYEGYGYKVVRKVSNVQGTSNKVKEIEVSVYKPADTLLYSLIVFRTEVVF